MASETGAELGRVRLCGLRVYARAWGATIFPSIGWSLVEKYAPTKDLLTRWAAGSPFLVEDNLSRVLHSGPIPASDFSFPIEYFLPHQQFATVNMLAWFKQLAKPLWAYVEISEFADHSSNAFCPSGNTHGIFIGKEIRFVVSYLVQPFSFSILSLPNKKNYRCSPPTPTWLGFNKSYFRFLSFMTGESLSVSQHTSICRKQSWR